MALMRTLISILLSKFKMERFILTLLYSLLLSSAVHPATSSLRNRLTFSDDLQETALYSVHSSPPSPTTYFEVRRPIPVPKSKPCSTLVLRHDFAFTYGKPPIAATYSPPSHCPLFRRRPASRIVLHWSAASAGRQFDRIFGVWLAGVELLRSCTAEPRATGTVWSVQKDVTRYASLFSKSQTLAVYLGNLVDKTYTGIYHVNVSFNFYFDKNPPQLPLPSVPAFRASPADLIIPISKSLSLSDGLWFQIQNSTDVQGKALSVPRNTYRAVLEVYLSFHSSDEFWYTNPPNSYISENNLTDLPGNGPFREVTVRLDGELVGAVWPFTVIYTGGVNPLLWRPISGIGSFDLPSYDIEITPFLGKILDGKEHYFGFGVTNALNVWFIDANLHLWLDSKSSITKGSLIKYQAPAISHSLFAEFEGLNGRFITKANRKISATGWVNSSYGMITTQILQKFHYISKMKFAGNGNIQVVNQNIDYNHSIYARHPISVLLSKNVVQTFPLYLYTATTDQVNNSYSLIANVTLGFNERKFSNSGSGLDFSFDDLKNLQNAQGIMQVKGNLVTSGLGTTQQVYNYTSDHGCYFRNVGSKNYTILCDESRKSCEKISQFGY